jgi:uncharacterized membrane protein
MAGAADAHADRSTYQVLSTGTAWDGELMLVLVALLVAILVTLLVTLLVTILVTMAVLVL